MSFTRRKFMQLLGSAAVAPALPWTPAISREYPTNPCLDIPLPTRNTILSPELISREALALFERNYALKNEIFAQAVDRVGLSTIKINRGDT